jgi:hypothetical protein
MSALTKPVVHFTNAVNADTIVAAEHIATADKLDIDALPNQPASTAKYFILLTLVYPGAGTKDVKIEFATSIARNASFTNLKTAISTAVA